MVQFRQEEKDYKVYDVGQITNIKMQGDFFCIDVEKKNWFLYGFDLILPEITEDDDNIIIQDKILDIRCVILTKKS